MAIYKELVLINMEMGIFIKESFQMDILRAKANIHRQAIFSNPWLVRSITH